MKKNREISLLDTTLRDGSYTIGYQFSLLDNMVICSGLEKAGVKHIEIGHGTGLGTYRIDNNSQAYSDKEYMLSASKSLSDAEFGFFFIPGIGNSDDISMLSDHDGDFIRIGTSIEGFKEAKKFIKLAKKLNIKFWINLMKSYVYSHKEFAEFSRVSLLEGAEGIYLVDSAGGMLPDEVNKYILEAKDKLASEDIGNFKLGFHGHENLSLGSACALSAVQSGADIIDGSLHGIGRSIGNSPIETLAMIISKAGYSISVDPWQLADLAQKTVKPYLENRWRNSSIEQALGFKEIHSNYLDNIMQFSDEKSISARDLILSLPKKANISVSDKDMAYAFRKLKSKRSQPYKNIEIDASVEREIHLSDPSLNQYIKDLISKGEKTNRNTVLILANQWRSSSNRNRDYSAQRIRFIENNEVGAVEVFCKGKPSNFDPTLLGKVKNVFIDSDLIKSNNFFKNLSSSSKHKILLYPDKNSILFHIARYLSVMSRDIEYTPKVKAVISCREDEVLLRSLLEGYGIAYEESDNKANIHILISDDSNTYDLKKSKNLKCVIDVRSGLLNKRDVNHSFRKKIKLIALDCESAVISEVLSNISIDNIINSEQGSRSVSGVRIVAKGEWGKEGDIVVDKINEPSFIIGASDGQGTLKSDPSSEDKKKLKKILNHLYNNKLN